MVTTLRRILLAEHSANDVELTRAALAERRPANKVDVVRDGAEALAYLYRRGRFEARPPANPCLLLLDLELPKVNGLEVLPTMKQGPVGPTRRRGRCRSQS